MRRKIRWAVSEVSRLITIAARPIQRTFVFGLQLRSRPNGASDRCNLQYPGSYRMAAPNSVARWRRTLDQRPRRFASTPSALRYAGNGGVEPVSGRLVNPLETIGGLGSTFKPEEPSGERLKI